MRQAAASASAKGWLLPIVRVTFGFALRQHSWRLAALLRSGAVILCPCNQNDFIVAISGTAMEAPAPKFALNLAEWNGSSHRLPLAELGRRVEAREPTLSRLFRDEVGMGYTVWRSQLLHLATPMLAGGRVLPMQV
jgi:AraC-like DNA-binding protein